MLALLVVAFLGGLPGGQSSHADCPLVAPVDAPIIRPYEPLGRFAGHWGVDYGVARGTAVGAAGAGTVTFSGTVAHTMSVTVDHGGGVKTSYSFLSLRAVAVGERVARGTLVGLSGPESHVAAEEAHDGLHFSVRVGGVYVDPARALRCVRAIPPGALRLIA